MILLGCNAGIFAQSTTFTYTGSVQKYTVPGGLTSVLVDVRGAQGGNAYNSYGVGGGGGREIATLAVTAGQVLNIYVGQQGTQGTGGSCSAGGGNSGGGGQGGNGCYYGGGGGGSSDVRANGSALSNRVVVGGGGGGGAWDCGESGGYGGGLTGQNGNDCGSYYTGSCGGGGKQNAGGPGATYGSSSGSLGVGGATYCNGYYGGGGGGGYYGGGGGYYGSGGGGSNFAGTGTSSVTNTQGYNFSGNGKVIISPPPPPGTVSYSYTGGVQYYTVPTGITSVTVIAAGAAGGQAAYGYSMGGCGGTTVCSLAVTPLQVLAVYCGGVGAVNCGGCTAAGGYNGGANGVTYGGGGGGASDVRTGAYGISNRVVVGGGGGGGAYNCSPGQDVGGAGGGLTGLIGHECGTVYCGYGGCGGTQSAGGGGGAYPCCGYAPGSAGTLGNGGAGMSYGAGGGGGYYGGGGGDWTGGGGGSSFAGTGTSGVVMTQGDNCGVGTVQIQPNCTAGVITGSLSTCSGGFTTQLTDVVTGGSWISTNTAVATVGSGTGLVTGLTAGTTTISYGGSGISCGNVWVTAVVTVTPAPGSVLGSNTICQALNQTYTLSSGSGGTWSTSNTSLATINGVTGVATGVAAGVVTISYSLSASCYSVKTVTVLVTAPITGPTTVCAGLSITLSDTNPAGGGAGTWSSGSPTTATIDPVTGVTTGVLTVLTPTVVSLSFTETNGCAVSYPITVNPLPATFTGPTQVCYGLNVTLGETSTGGTWMSTTTTVATVATATPTTETVYGIGAGTSVITYTLPTSCIMTTTMTVNPLPLPIIGNPNICYGLTYTLSDPTPLGTWSSSNVNAQFLGGPTNSNVTGMNLGASILTYTLPTTCIATMTATVQPNPSGIVGNAPVCVNANVLLSDVTPGGLWSSSNTAQAKIGAGTGNLLGVAGPTNPNITYTLPTGCIAFTTATVNPNPATIGFPSGSAPNSTVCVGSSVTLTAVIGGTWISSNPGIASIVPLSGLLTGIVPGVPTITYKYTATGCFNTTSVTVNPAPSPITGANAVCFGLSTTLNDVTPGGVWSSSSPGIATVGSTGIVTGVSSVGGTTNINYTLTAIPPAAVGCSATMVLKDNPLPTAFALFPNTPSAYCPGTPAPDVHMNNSVIGVNYQLYNGVTPIPPSSPLAGTGSGIDYGPQTAAGTYKVIATDATTGCVNTMSNVSVISINPAPHVDSLIGSNGGNFCTGSGGSDLSIKIDSPGLVYTLYEAGFGAVGIAFSGSADFGSYTSSGVYTATVQNSYGCIANELGSVTVTENLLPDVHNVTGGGSYCALGSGVHIGLDNSNSGVNYQLWNTTTSTLVTTLAGSNSSLDFGLQTAAGTYQVIAINAITGCSNTMNGNPTVDINALPNPYTVSVSGSSSYCKGGTGVDIRMSGSDNYVNYQLFDGGTPIGAVVPGTGSAFDFPLDTMIGTYTVIGIDQTSGCTNNMPGSATVNIYAALGVHKLSAPASSYCFGGTGVDFTLDNSEAGISYILYNGATALDTITSLGGGPLDFGLQTLAGTYSAMAVNMATTCTANMTGTPSLAINALPTPYTITATNGGNYCAGDPGVTIGLSFSDIGISYQLWKSGVMVGSAVAGSSSAINFGTFTATGTYNVIATNSITMCTSDMLSNPTIIKNALPATFTVTGGGSYCVGGTGKHVGLSGSQVGVNYQLFIGGNPDVILPGTGGVLDFGLETTVNMYTVVATNTTTMCTNNMSGSAVITTNSLPTVFTVTGGGDFCAGSTGVHVGLNGSTTGINYQLYNGVLLMGSPVKGVTGKTLDFGIQTAGGTYTVVGTNAITGCSSNMASGAIVTVDPLPNVYKVAGGGAYCAGSGGADISLSGSDAGINYQLYNGGKQVGVAVSGTGIALDLGPQTGTGTYTVVGVDGASGCSSNMTGSTSVSINALPAAYTITGSGHYCAGGVGIPVYLSGSHTGISYQLYNGTALAGKPVSGTGGALSFGAQTAGGTYTAVATNTATGCMNTMNGSSTVVVDPIPDAFAITGGGNYCAGGAGVLIGQVGSVSGINYQLYNGTTPVGLPVGGTGAVLNFGLETGAGTYMIRGTNITTGCWGNMTGTTNVVVDKVVTPSVSIATSTGDDIACIGAATVFTATAVNGGSTPTYQWSVNGVPAVVGNPYTYIPANGDIVGVKLTSDAACATSSTATKSITMTTIPYEMPSANITITPGNNVCQGTTVSLAATMEFGGNAPAHMWLKNSVPVGTGMSYSYTPGASNNGDVLIFMLVSNYRCRTVHTDTVFSNNFVMIVDSAQMPKFTISSHLGPIIGVGQVDTFIATVTNGVGALMNYQWMINNTPVPGATSSLYIDYNVFNNDVISCDVTRTGVCGGQSATVSQKVVNLKNVGVQQLSAGNSDISVLPNPNKGEFTVKGSLGTASDEEVTIEITNMLGQVVYKGKVTAHNGNLDEHIQLGRNIANGMYLLNLHSAVANNVFHVVIEQ